MIIDKLSKINEYSITPEVVDFVRNITPDISVGKHIISESIYANVELYDTKQNGKFERHLNYIDLQFLLSGNERIYYNYVADIIESPIYDKVRDIAFFDKNIFTSPYVKLDSSNFALIFPHEAHAPQIEDEISQKVKKVVVKIPV